MRMLWLTIAWASIIIGVVGVFLPLLPTTPFLLLSAGIFARVSPRFESWLVAHPTLGLSVRAWRDRKAINQGAKVSAVVAMICSLCVLVWLDPGPLALAIVATALSACAAFVITRPSA
ncbi:MULTISPECIES: YbaN family protein [unclassified Rhizobium]|uniref:YbaN family protein n=1 Tax=unclassified Rhizobium TaxID=2613769 RepID=UPI001ADB9731|nr:MULTISPECIES: DUF454 family protein [unclassified Rhizobium]MBO9126948.1 YbaN family protein [Rhizobium sp. 16-488-2b]MBO9177396.1 YbaN family protein [Rhizobium sp. 16-488-2a]